MTQISMLYGGMDVHPESMAVAYVAQDHHAQVIYLGTIATRYGGIDQRIRNMQSEAKQLVFVDEAGTCGDWLERDLCQNGSDGWVVAPSLRPTTASDRGNTDRRLDFIHFRRA
jgi:transposase